MSDERPVLWRTFEAPLETHEGRMVEGCVVPYDQPTKVRDGPDMPVYWERFEHGVFRKQLGAATRVRLRFQHGSEIFNRIGRCHELHDEASGLYGAFAVYPGMIGDQALELVRAGELTGFSVGFSDRYSQWRRDGDVVVRQNCVLHEVSLVEEPAYVSAVVTGVRSRAELLGDLELPAIAGEQLERLRALGIQV